MLFALLPRDVDEAEVKPYLQMERLRDAMLWSVADDADCSILLTEDLQHGRRLGNVTFINPFATRKLPDIVRDVLG